jgi:hypothetical protein
VSAVVDLLTALEPALRRYGHRFELLGLLESALSRGDLVSVFEAQMSRE